VSGGLETVKQQSGLGKTRRTGEGNDTMRPHVVPEIVLQREGHRGIEPKQQRSRGEKLKGVRKKGRTEKPGTDQQRDTGSNSRKNQFGTRRPGKGARIDWLTGVKDRPRNLPKTTTHALYERKNRHVRSDLVEEKPRQAKKREQRKIKTNATSISRQGKNRIDKNGEAKKRTKETKKKPKDKGQGTKNVAW